MKNSFYKKAASKRVTPQRSLREKDRWELPLRRLLLYLNFIPEAHAANDCTQCSGNPFCLLLCRSAASGGTRSGGGGSGGSLINISGPDLSGIQNEISSTNSQLDALNATIGGTNGQMGNINTSLNGFNNNHANTNTQLANANANHQNVNNTIDQRSQEALRESKTWRAMTKQEMEQWRLMTERQ